MSRKFLGLFLVFFFCATSLVFAEKIRPLQVSIWSPVQLVSASNSIAGLRFNLVYTDNKDVSGISLGAGWARTGGGMKGIELGAVNWTDGLTYGFKSGFLNYTGRRSVGLDLAAINIIKGEMTGFQAGIANYNYDALHGWELGFVNYINGRFIGIQNGFLNIIEGDLSGLQTGIINSVNGAMTGLQLSLFNYAASSNGLQLGLFNTTNSLGGLQLGLSNYAGPNAPIEWCPFVNWSF